MFTSDMVEHELGMPKEHILAKLRTNEAWQKTNDKTKDIITRWEGNSVLTGSEVKMLKYHMTVLKKDEDIAKLTKEKQLVDDELAKATRLKQTFSLMLSRIWKRS